MKKIVAILMLLACIAPACKKEKSANAETESKTLASFELDGEQVSINYPGNEVNQCSMYSFGGWAGNYFGVSSMFQARDKIRLDIVFGTFLSKNTELTEEEFVGLIAPGERKYGSLGSFNSNPELHPNKVEIALTDKQAKRWCSTEITEKETADGPETVVNVEQEESKFVIEQIEHMLDSQNKSCYRISGKFSCFVYEVNGKAKKKMKGKFTGILSRPY